MVLKMIKISSKNNTSSLFQGFRFNYTSYSYNLKFANRFEGFELTTGLCNQDLMERLFSKLRQRGGFNPNPTVKIVRLSIRRILSTGYIQT